MKINVSYFKKYIKKFWYIYVATFLSISLAAMLFMVNTQKVTYICKTELALNSNASNSSCEFVFKNASELIEADAFKEDFLNYYKANTEKELDLSLQKLSLEKQATSTFIYVVSSSLNATLSKETSAYCSDFLMYLSSEEGMKQHNYATFFKTAPIVQKTMSNIESVEKKYSTLNYIGGIALAFAISLATLTISLAVNKKMYVEE